tara:strand:- start:4811 stop:5539 length:729 start_codon:yes stop_codon:yes gene_type:complete
MTHKKNMVLWNQVCETDPKYTKKLTYGAKLTTIDAQSQILKATEIWGPFGGNWGLKSENYDVTSLTGTCVYTADFYYLDGEEINQFPISSDIKIREDFMKSVQTDALTKALSRLGFNADVFMGRFDNNKYIQEMNAKFGDKKEGVSQKPTSNLVSKQNEEKERSLPTIDTIFKTKIEVGFRSKENHTYKSGYKTIEELRKDLQYWSGRSELSDTQKVHVNNLNVLIKHHNKKAIENGALGGI